MRAVKSGKSILCSGCVSYLLFRSTGKLGRLLPQDLILGCREKQYYHRHDWLGLANLLVMWGYQWLVPSGQQTFEDWQAKISSS